MPHNELGRKIIPFHVALHLAETALVEKGVTKWKLRKLRFPNPFRKLRNYFFERVTTGEERRTVREG